MCHSTLQLLDRYKWKILLLEQLGWHAPAHCLLQI